MQGNKKSALSQGPHSASTPTQAKKSAKKKAEPAKVDRREQLVNDGEVGEIAEVSIPEDMITSLRGIMLDLDPKLLGRKIVPNEIRDKPKKFCDQVVSPWLGRHPVLKKAEVRNSGT